eukprot:TRINITY_DN81925_c0_g1_i1.p1 TRINITY_DN81925_c0_g1~~TRINITY_DN81925_c0_g1_i1.p1  ORF type:complete len:603 (-),score=54.48 TRINITY_DN81925_c0_g1_i1:127-1935(-)
MHEFLSQAPSGEHLAQSFAPPFSLDSMAKKPRLSVDAVSSEEPLAQERGYGVLGQQIVGCATVDELRLILKANPDLSVSDTGHALNQLSLLLTTSALLSQEQLQAELAGGRAVEAPPLLSKWPTKAALTSLSPASHAFLYVHERVEALLDDLPARPQLSAEWLQSVSTFYASFRPGPPFPKHVLEDCADEVLERLNACRDKQLTCPELASYSLVARACASSGVLGRHDLYGTLASCLSERLTQERELLLVQATHDCALSMALIRPWDADTADSAERLRERLDRVVEASPTTPAGDSAKLRSSCHSFGVSLPGRRGVDEKENQDAFITLTSDSAGSSALLSVVDGHGPHGALVAEHLQRNLPRFFRFGAGSDSNAEVAAYMLDAALLLDDAIDTSLSGAACASAVLVREQTDETSWKISIAWMGDCRVLLGHLVAQNPQDKAAGLGLQLMYASSDHRPGDLPEAGRIVQAGGKVQAVGPPGSSHQDDRGPPRVWNRLSGLAPGLALSRAFGDSLGKAAGVIVNPQVTSLVCSVMPKQPGFLILGSDGLFDVLEENILLKLCHPYIVRGDPKGAADVLVAEAKSLWDARGAYRDDITVVVAILS